jgi:uncharacterized protein (DUF849 family)
MGVRRDEPLIIEVALNGINTKERNPNVPQDPVEIRADAFRCLDAGATLLHAHNRDIRRAGREAADEYLDAWRGVMDERPDTLWYPTLAFAPDARLALAHVEILREEIGLRIAPVDPGSTNLGRPDDAGLPVGLVYSNDYDSIRSGFDLCRDLGMGPSLAIYEPGFLRTVLTYDRAGRLPAGSMVKLYFGGEYGLLSYLDMLEGTDLPWSVSVWGGDLAATPLARMAMEHGGHVHVGLEEHFGARKPSNEELVGEMADLAREVGRPLATPAETASILGLP